MGGLHVGGLRQDMIEDFWLRAREAHSRTQHVKRAKWKCRNLTAFSNLLLGRGETSGGREATEVAALIRPLSFIAPERRTAWVSSPVAVLLSGLFPVVCMDISWVDAYNHEL